jgi:hypothetical protein
MRNPCKNVPKNSGASRFPNFGILRNSVPMVVCATIWDRVEHMSFPKKKRNRLEVSTPIRIRPPRTTMLRRPMIVIMMMVVKRRTVIVIVLITWAPWRPSLLPWRRIEIQNVCQRYKICINEPSIQNVFVWVLLISEFHPMGMTLSYR